MLLTISKITHDAYQLPDLNEQIIKLNDQEIADGYKILGKKIKKKYKGIVLFCVRDNYNNQTLYPKTDWSNNEFRNYKFENFIPSINFLNSNNYLVIRMGRLNEKEIVLKMIYSLIIPFVIGKVILWIIF